MKSQTSQQDSSRLIFSESALKPELSRIGSWQIAADAIAQRLAFGEIAKNNWWKMFLIAVGTAGSIIYPHVPLVGFAAVAGNTLTSNKALMSAMSICGWGHTSRALEGRCQPLKKSLIPFQLKNWDFDNLILYQQILRFDFNVHILRLGIFSFTISS